MYGFYLSLTRTTLSVIRLNVYCASRTIMHLFLSGRAAIPVRATVCKQARSSDWVHISWMQSIHTVVHISWMQSALYHATDWILWIQSHIVVQISCMQSVLLGYELATMSLDSYLGLQWLGYMYNLRILNYCATDWLFSALIHTLVHCILDVICVLLEY